METNYLEKAMPYGSTANLKQSKFLFSESYNYLNPLNIVSAVVALSTIYWTSINSLKQCRFWYYFLLSMLLLRATLYILCK